MADKCRDLGLTYEQAAHGIQTAVLHRMQLNHEPGTDLTGPASPKHLRVGVNIRAAEFGALAKLLIDKGVFTPAEIREEMRLALNDELARYEDDAPAGISYR